jgi:leader peptidase (prepilin peptidase)/N-methyltransferase
MDPSAALVAVEKAMLSPAVAVAAAFTAGAFAGSFLNVVAHRVPRGESFVGGRSRCPACGNRIRARDNVPILGWLLVSGRCRDCRQPISARYPVVETTCGLLLAALAVSIRAVPGPTPLVLWIDRGLIVLVLTAGMLLAVRGHVVRGSTAAATALAAAIAASSWPALAPLGIAADGSSWPSDPAWVSALLASIAGACAGWFGGWLGAGPAGRNAWIVVGATLGWQAVALGTVTITGLCAIMPNRDRIPWLVTVVAHTLLIIWPLFSRAWQAAPALFPGG